MSALRLSRWIGCANAQTLRVRRLPAVLLVLVVCGAVLHAAYALVINAAAGSSGGGNVTTSPGVNTSGSNLAIIGLGDYQGATAADPVDNKSGGYAGCGAASEIVNEARARIFYATNPSFGSGHTFSSNGGGGTFPSVAAATFSGAYGAPCDQTAGTSGVAATIQPGSITPSQDNELVITVVSWQASLGTVSINGHGCPSNYTITDQVAYSAGNHFGVAMAYCIQATATPTNPTWTFSAGGQDAAVRIASFKMASATGARRRSIIGGGVF